MLLRVLKNILRATGRPDACRRRTSAARTTRRTPRTVCFAVALQTTIARPVFNRESRGSRFSPAITPRRTKTETRKTMSSSSSSSVNGFERKTPVGFRRSVDIGHGRRGVFARVRTTTTRRRHSRRGGAAPVNISHPTLGPRRRLVFVLRKQT